MADFSITGAAVSTTQFLNGGEHGFIAPNTGISVLGGDGVEATAGENWLTVLGYINATGGTIAAVDGGGTAFEMTVGRDGYLTAENPIGGTVDIDVSQRFSLVNEGTIYSSRDYAVEMRATDGSAEAFLRNTGAITANEGNAILLATGTEEVEFYNSGSITSDDVSVFVVRTESATGDITFNNTGEVLSGDLDAFLIAAGDGSTTDFFNSGIISADATAIEFEDDGQVSIRNTGTIQGETRAIETEGGDDELINLGTIIGNVDLGGGSDTIDSRGGIITEGALRGGAGDDLYLLDSDEIFVAEEPGGGTDFVLAWSDFHISDPDIENLSLRGSGSFRGAGNASGNRIEGNVGDNALFGFSGNDELTGGAGDDKIFGSFGVDTITGDDGDDWLHGGADGDNIAGGTGNDTIEGGTGNDFLTTGGFAGARNIADGGADNDILLSGESSDSLIGGSGDDTILPGAGADTIRGGSGVDVVNYGASPDRVVVNIGVNFFSGGHAEGDAGSDLEGVYGGAGNDLLVGSSGPNVLRGDSGDDSLRAEGGNDTLRGGEGADTLNGGSGADTADYGGSSARVIINLGTGFTSGGDAAGDTLISIERVSGSALGDRIVGSSAGNRLFGEDGDDYLDGGGAGDLLFGGAGNDELVGGTGADQFIFESGFGDDTINDFEDGSDLLHVAAIPGVNSIADVSIAPSGGDLVVQIGVLDSITLLGANGSVTLTSADFIF
ncbi:calcium-binding protein [Cognatishimia sp. F0-27]|uniref:calcium-binding protein n=1 Tax=Cognatishimia sp. F0-27 TaxID=2816855 RepID=UPI001D0C7838|nr:calcium-binding protein [Cognatishimia sp. F0-27]MCC1494430.1 hypothetical protein [Cognatishimia sp. F0-27]